MLLNHGNVGHRPNCFKTALPMPLDNRESRYLARRVSGVIQNNIEIKRYSLCQLSSGKIVEIHSEPFLNFTKLSTWYRKEHPRNVFYWKIHTARLCLQFLFKDAF